MLHFATNSPVLQGAAGANNGRVPSSNGHLNGANRNGNAPTSSNGYHVAPTPAQESAARIIERSTSGGHAPADFIGDLLQFPEILPDVLSFGAGLRLDFPADSPEKMCLDLLELRAANGLKTSLNDIEVALDRLGKTNAAAATARDKIGEFAGALDNEITRENALDVALGLARHLADKRTQKQSNRKILILSSQAVKEQCAPMAIIDGVLYVNNTAELCGGHATFKSFQALAMAEAVAGGHDWHSRQTKKMPVVYITGEGRGGASQRIRALEIRHQRPCEVQFILEAVQLHRPDEVEALLWAIANLPEVPGLIVVDTLARCFVGGDENSARDAGLFVAGVDRIRAATGAAVLVLHHLSKAGDSRGSTAFSGAFDTIVEAKRENTTVTLRCLKQKDAADFEPMTLVRRIVELDETDEYGRPLTSLIFEATDAPCKPEAQLKADGTRDQIMEVLRNAGKSLRATDWQERVEKELNVKSSAFYTHRRILLEEGRVAEGAGLYCVIEK